MSPAPRPPKDHAARHRAASDFDTSFVVSAGAGTGKTTLLIERILTAIGTGTARLPELAAITFTDKASGELRHRLGLGLGELGSLAGGVRRDARPSAARRVYDRMIAEGRIDPAAFGARAAEAEAALDRASVTTIHGLCSEILRAHPLECGLPPGFVADKGVAGRRLASEEWTRFVEDELGPSGLRADLWERVLAKLRLREVEKIARALAGGAISDAALRAGLPRFDLRAAVGNEALRLAGLLRSAVEGTEGLTPAPREWLLEAEAALRSFAKGGAAIAKALIKSSSRIPDEMPEVRTKNVSPSDASALERLEARVRPYLRGVCALDERAEADLVEALRPFALRLRERQVRAGVIDFDGLLVRTRDLLRDAPAVRASLKRRFKMILVDEFQDIDPIQYEIVLFLAEREDESASDAYVTRLAPGRLFIVGDAKQSIYRFRGADFGAYRRAVDHVLRQGGVRLSLTSNFRSTPEVLGPVNALFAEPGSPIWRESEYLSAYEPIDAERDGGNPLAVEIWTTGVDPDAPAWERRRAEGLALAAELSKIAGPGREWRYEDVLVLFRGFSDLAPYLRALRDAGVPFVVSGARSFFGRTEIVQAMAVLRAVCDPADEVARLAYLRSPAGGVPDTELFAAASNRRAAAPALTSAIDRLAALRAAIAPLPVDAAVRRVLQASGLMLLSGLAFEGAQRVANLEKFAAAASELARDGRRTLSETLAALEEGFDADDEGDSPLADADRDAVRVMSIHRAKGLEAPFVVLADTAGGRGPRRKARVVTAMARFGSAEFLRLDGPAFRSAAAIAASLDDAQHEAAEDVRLLYVALTRARDRLVVFGGGSRRTAWVDAIAAWGGVARRSVAAGDPERTTGASHSPGAPAAVALYETAVAAVVARADPPFASPSEGDRPDEGIALATGGTLTPSLARETGRIVHARLAGLGTVAGGAAFQEAERVLSEFAGSPLAPLWAGLDVLGREIPVLLSEPGARWRGAIDLLYRDADGAVVVADFKIDASDDGAIERHRDQLRVYADAVRRAVPGARVRAELWMLRSGRVLEV